MKMRVLSLVVMLVCVLQMMAVPVSSAAGAIADGTYTIDYVITKPENESVSMANDYFEKPAELHVHNGTITAQLQMNHSKWITVFNTALGSEFPNAKVMKNDKEQDTRSVQFKLEDLSKPMLSKIHVTVPDIDYDHDYTIRFVFDESTLKQVGAVKSSKAATTTEVKGSFANEAAKVKASTDMKINTASVAEPNPKTGDDMPMKLLWLLAGMSGAGIIVFGMKRKRSVK